MPGALTFEKRPPHGWAVHQDGTLLGTVRRHPKGGWSTQPVGDEQVGPADRPTRREAARRLLLIATSRRAHERDTRPAPQPAGFELVDVSDLEPGDLTLSPNRLNTEGGVQEWDPCGPRVVHRFEPYPHADGGTVFWEADDAGSQFYPHMGYGAWRQVARRSDPIGG